MKRTFLILATLMAVGVFSNDLGAMSPRKENRADFIFLFIGDGMGHAQTSAAESYLSYKAGKIGGERLTFTGFPFYGMSETYSANSQVTDSAAGGTAIACGVKAKNGMIGTDKDSVAVKSIASVLHEEGYNVGIISTAPVNHATPAAFYAHSVKRKKYYDISKQIASSGFEFFAGAGFIDFYSDQSEQERIDEYLEDKGCQVSFGMKEFSEESMKAERIVLCQPDAEGKNAGNYVVKEYSWEKNENNINLRQMLQAGMNFLADKEPFFIMCEGGDIDWAAHANQIMPMIDRIIEFDQAVEAAYEFYLKYPERTLIVVTADHETGGTSIGCGGKEAINWGKVEDDYKNGSNRAGMNEIGWTSNEHTGAPVPVYAIGCGAEKFIGRMDNTEIMGKIIGR